MRLAGLAAAAVAAGAAAGTTGAEAQEPSLMLDEITILSAARDARPLLDTPVAATVLEGEALDVKQATNFQELIGDAPGLAILGGPRGIAQEPNIRGFSDDQIVLRFDGGRANFNDAHRGRFFIDPDIIQRVEIIRGGGSTLYGSGALGGVIALDTKDVDDLLAPDDTWGGRLSSGWSSNGDIGQASATLYGRHGRFDALGFLGWQPMGKDLEDGDGNAIRSSQIDLGNALAKFGFEPNEANRFELSGSVYHDDGTTPRTPTRWQPPTPTSTATPSPRWSASRLGLAPAESDLVDLTALVYWNDLEDHRGPLQRRPQRRHPLRDPRHRRHQPLALRPRPPGHPRLRHRGVPRQPGRHPRRRGPHPVPRGRGDDPRRLRRGDRRRHREARGRPRPPHRQLPPRPERRVARHRRRQLPLPRLGISYRPTDNWQLYGNVARAFRAPSMIELYNDGVHFAIPGFPLFPGAEFSGVNYFIPNPDLEPEKSTQFELGTRYSRQDVFRAGDSLDFTANAYYADVTDFIDQTVLFIDEANPVFGPGGMVFNGATMTDNVDARLWGLDATADYDAGPWFAGLILTVPRGEETGGGALGSIPQDRVTVSAGIRPSFDWELGARATFAAKQDDVPEGSEPADAWTTVDLFAAWAPEIAALDGTVFRAGIDNLFDETYSIYPNGLNQPGRTFKGRRP